MNGTIPDILELVTAGRGEGTATITAAITDNGTGTNDWLLILEARP